MDIFFFSSRRRHTRLQGDWSSDVCSSDLDWETYVATSRSVAPPTRFLGIAPNGFGFFTCASTIPRTVSRPDRKSTRLNSSHLVISYAVFCLKKKTTTNQIAFPHVLP